MPVHVCLVLLVRLAGGASCVEDSKSVDGKTPFSALLPLLRQASVAGHNRRHNVAAIRHASISTPQTTYQMLHAAAAAIVCSGCPSSAKWRRRSARHLPLWKDGWSCQLYPQYERLQAMPRYVDLSLSICSSGQVPVLYLKSCELPEEMCPVLTNLSHTGASSSLFC